MDIFEPGDRPPLDPLIERILAELGFDLDETEVEVIDLSDPQAMIQKLAWRAMYPDVVSWERTGGKCEQPDCECGGTSDAVRLVTIPSFVN